jgi:hypothetical protein
MKNQLIENYTIIGKELVFAESHGTVASFREGIASVPLEVLESYLEDLLDYSVSEDVLSINRERPWFYSFRVLAFGVLGSVIGGLYSVSVGASVLSSFSLTLILGAPFGAILYLAPRMGLMRRMKFARIVSAEIARRRGKDDQDRGQYPLFVFSDVLKTPKGSVPGAARAFLWH